MIRQTWAITGFALLASVAAWAGPPAVCHAIEIGDAKSLPWSVSSTDFKKGDPSYDINRLVPDTLALLSPSMPVKVRMETMRRAALYSAGAPDGKLALELFNKLKARVDSNNADAMAWFDAGYFAQTLKQAALVYKWDMLSKSEKKAWAIKDDIVNVDGYEWVQKSLALKGGNSADIRYALTLINYERPNNKAVMASKD